MSDPDEPLVLGPMLRYIGEREATVWVETSRAARVYVELLVDDRPRTWSAPTFAVEGHHYALVVVDGLEPGGSWEYTVHVGAEGEPAAVWPPPDGSYPHPRIHTIDRARPTRLLFGSCRTSEPHDREGNETNGVDALRALALALAAGTEEWPDLVAFLGDQVYADLTSKAMQEFIATRRSLDEPPGEEIKDYEEYAHLYWLAWRDEANRWLLSTVPSCMIFDDHDIRDDWNTSFTWHEEMNKTSWWHERLMGGLASYWVYQHIGNLSPAQLAEDEVYAQVLAYAAGLADAETPGGEGAGEQRELDLTEAVFDLARRADRHPEAYRWSYRRDLGDSRLVVVDSRAGRVLEPHHRSMLDRGELAWLGEQLTGDVDHLFIGTSLPFLLPPGLHDLEAIDEVLASRSGGGVVARLAERLRQVVDLEHWAAFNDGFDEVFEMVMDVARGNRGRPPATVVFLSGDVHNSYVAEVVNGSQHGARSRIVQAVCSPIRNPMPVALRVMMSAFARGLVRPMRAIASRSERVPDPAYPWRVTDGPWFDNCLAEVQVEGPDLSFVWRAGEVEHGDDLHPVVRTLAQVRVEGARTRTDVTNGSVLRP
jgi:hypothetical protein